MEFDAANFKAWLRSSMKLDYSDFGGPEMKKRVALSMNGGKQGKEEYLQS